MYKSTYPREHWAPLRNGTTPEQATAVFAMMTSPASWQQLTQRSGWTFDQSET